MTALARFSMKHHNSMLVLAFLLSAHPLHADEGFSAFVHRVQWHGSSLSVAVFCIGACVCVGVIFLLYAFRQNSLQKKIREKNAYTLFLENAAAVNLDNEEKKRLWSIMHQQNIPSPAVLFDSVAVYEQVLDLYAQSLCAEKGLSKAIKEDAEILYALRKKLGFQRLTPELPLISTRNISIGQTGALYGKDLRTPLVRQVRVTDMNEFTLTIASVHENEGNVIMQPEDTIRFVFTRQGDGFYGIDLQVVSYNRGLFEAVHTLNLKRDQLRHHVRVEVSLPVCISLLRFGTVAASPCPTLEGCRLVDLSGGGFSFVSGTPLRESDTIIVGFDLPGVRLSGLTARILRISQSRTSTGIVYKHHSKFIDIERKVQDSIVRFVFDKQRTSCLLH